MTGNCVHVNLFLGPLQEWDVSELLGFCSVTGKFHDSINFQTISFGSNVTVKWQLENCKQWAHKTWMNSKSSSGLIEPFSEQWKKCGKCSSYFKEHYCSTLCCLLCCVLIHFKVYSVRTSWVRRGLIKTFKYGIPSPILSLYRNIYLN